MANRTDSVAGDPGAVAWADRPPLPLLDLEPMTAAELDAIFKGGEVEADAIEKTLAWAARADGALQLALAEGLDLLCQGTRLEQLGVHLEDYGREILDVSERSTKDLARLGAALRTRPLLREALRSGRVGLRAAQTVLPVARGDAEAGWVELATVRTVRELEGAVRKVRANPEDADEPWLLLHAHLPQDDRLVVDAALEVAGRVVPGASRLDRIEAIAQEFLGGFATDDGDEPRRLGPAFRRIGEEPLARHADREREEEADAEARSLLAPVAAWPAPDVRFEQTMTAREVDRELRGVARFAARCEEVIGYAAHAIRRSGMHLRMGFRSFRAYLADRLRLPPRAVEQRERLEKRLWGSPALREARRQKVSYERLKLLATLREDEIRSWIPRAKAWTCIQLRREVEGERERQLRVRRKLVCPMPRRIAVLLAAAVEAVRERAGRTLPVARCLAIIAAHFIACWEPALTPPRTRAQKVRQRDLGRCQVPGCSHRAVQSHHVAFRSRGGSDDEANQISLCAFHHLRCIHGGWMRVIGEAPHALEWSVGGEVFSGMP